MKFTEAQLESAIIELLGAEGYPQVLGEALGERSSSCVTSTKDGAGAPSLPGLVDSRETYDQTISPFIGLTSDQNLPKCCHKTMAWFVTKKGYSVGVQSIDDKVISRIHGHQRGWVLSKNDFCNIA